MILDMMTILPEARAQTHPVCEGGIQAQADHSSASIDRTRSVYSAQAV